NQGGQSFPEHPFLEACVPKPFLNLILRWKKFISPSTRENIDQRVWWKPVLEIFILLIWAMWIGRDYLNLNSHVIPAGREFGSVVQANHLWTRFETCGWFAWVDGEPTQLIGEKWLETTALPGKHTYRFEYRPWDVPLGIFFMLLGLTFSIGYLSIKDNTPLHNGNFEYSSIHGGGK
ncbi:MAG TPA: hypothetical protein G4N95_06345, partial [Anaerolineae bacterium]|nr:hypothetical protein [Anaerolineae bacterium]